MAQSPLLSPAVLAALVLIALATLTPGSGQGGWGLGFPDPADLLLNIALFVPLGMAMRSWAGPERARQASPLRVALLTALGLSTAIELLQLTVIPGRDASPWDVLANTTGAALGAWLPAAMLTVPLIPAWFLSGWLLAPTPPPTRIWWGQWAHQFGGPVPFSGVIRAAALNGLPAPDQALGETITAEMKAGYARPPMQYIVHLESPTSPSRVRVQVAGVADGVGGEVVGWWQIGWDLELSWYARGTRLGLRSPSLRLPGLLFLDPDGEVALEARLQPTRVSLALADDQHGEEYDLVLGPWQGWRLFWPLEPPGPGWAWLVSVLWTGVCLGLPVALWVAWRRKK